MSEPSAPVVLSETDARGVATVTLNRPAGNNAYNRDMIVGLTEALGRFAEHPSVRLVVLRGTGRYFQAGADLAFLQAAAAMPPEENLDVSRRTVALMDALQNHPK